MILIIAFGYFDIHAQQLFTLRNRNQVNLSTKENERYLKIRDDYYSKQSRIVTLGSIPNALQQGELAFNLPIENRVIVASTEIFNYTSENTYQWAGKLKNDAGYMAIVADKGNILGFIHTKDKFYMIDYLKTGVNLFIEQDKEKYNQMTNTCGDVYENILNSQTPIDDDGSICDENYNDCAALIRVLVIWTPEAIHELSDNIDNPILATLYAGLGGLYINLAFINSDIPNKNVHCQSVIYNNFNFTTDYQIDHENLRNSEDIELLRYEYGADVVVLVSDLRYGPVIGAASFGYVQPEAAHILLVAKHWFSNQYVFAHELGHILSCDHSHESNGGDSPLSYCGHGLSFNDQNNINRTTIMAYGSGDSKILHYSNPDILFNGARTGIPLWAPAPAIPAYNANVIRKRACEVGNHLVTPDFVVSIGGIPSMCNQPATFYADIQPAGIEGLGTPPYNYIWRWNTTGQFNLNNQGIILGNTSSITISSPIECGSFYLMLTVTSSDGAVATRIRKIYTNNCPDCLKAPTEERAISTTYIKGIDSIETGIFPNPAEGKQALQLKLPKESSVQYTISDISGKTLHTVNLNILSIGVHTIPIDISQLSAGSYYLYISIDGIIRTEKLIITKF